MKLRIVLAGLGLALAACGGGGEETTVVHAGGLELRASLDPSAPRVGDNMLFVELRDGVPVPLGGMTVTPFEVVHASGAPAHALRVEDGERVLTYSGDTEWTDRLLDAARGVDLFVCEALFWDRSVKFHLDHATVRAHAAALGARRILLTHMGPEMLAHRAEAAFECAHDGLVLEV